MAKANVELPGFTDNPMVTSVETDSDEDSSSSDDSNSGEVASYVLSRSVIDSEFEKKLTCCRLFGCSGVLYLTLLAGAFGAHSAIVYMHTHDGYSPFQRWNKPRIFIFLTFQLLFFILFVRTILPSYWRGRALSFYKKDRSASRRRKNRQKIRRKKKNAVIRAYRKYNELLGLNGKFYLYRLYLFELIETVNNINNMRQIYLCSYPHVACMVLFAVLIFEACFRAHGMAGFLWKHQPVSKDKRDAQITVDVCVDTIFIFAPFLVWDGTKFRIMRFTLGEMLSLTAIPSISLFSKLRKNIKETILNHADQIATRLERKDTKLSLSRFSRSESELIESKQGRHFHTGAKVAVFAFSTVYAIFLVVIASVQLANVQQIENSCECFVSPVCTTNTTGTSFFSSGCRVKVPFCRDMFAPTCNCALFEQEGHSLKELSEDFGELTALRYVKLQSGPLRRLPTTLKRLNKLTYFDISFNRLGSFDVDIKGWHFLLDLRVGYNNVSTMHPSVWKHTTLVNLRLNSNKGLRLPDSGISLPELYYLDIGNNSAILPKRLGPQEFPKLTSLYIDENILRGDGIYPEGMEEFQSVDVLGIARLGITKLPAFMMKYKLLSLLDVRNNRISNLTEVENKYIDELKTENGIRLYMSGNPGCPSGLTSCELQCSIYCYDYILGDGECDPVCNSISCEFDDADC